MSDDYNKYMARENRITWLEARLLELKKERRADIDLRKAELREQKLTFRTRLHQGYKKWELRPLGGKP